MFGGKQLIGSYASHICKCESGDWGCLVCYFKQIGNCINREINNQATDGQPTNPIIDNIKQLKYERNSINIAFSIHTQSKKKLLKF